jgi:hypothetical protein
MNTIIRAKSQTVQTKRQQRCIGRGLRMHHCEHCGEIYICEHCTSAMVDAQTRAAANWRYADQALYDAAHLPWGWSGQSREPWLCDDCLEAA